MPSSQFSDAELAEAQAVIDTRINAAVEPLRQQVKGLMARTSRPPGSVVDPVGIDGALDASAGQQFIESDGLKSLLSSPGQRGKAIISVNNLFASREQKQITSAGAIPPPLRITGIIPQQRRDLRMRDLIPVRIIADQVGSIDYLRQKPRTTTAAPQKTEGDIKSELTLQTDLLTMGFVTIAAWTACSKQVLMDLIGLMQFINGELSYSVMLEEEREILNGVAVNGELAGLLPGATPFDGSLSQTGDTNLDQLARAETQLLRSDVIPTAFVINPVDMSGIETLKSTIGTYLSAEPGDADFSDSTLWGLQVVVSNSMPAGKFLCGDFTTGCGLFDRQSALIEMSTEHADFFTRNLIAIRCEERTALGIFKPWAFVAGTFTGATAAAANHTHTQASVKK